MDQSPLKHKTTGAIHINSYNNIHILIVYMAEPFYSIVKTKSYFSNKSQTSVIHTLMIDTTVITKTNMNNLKNMLHLKILKTINSKESAPITDLLEYKITHTYTSYHHFL